MQSNNYDDTNIAGVLCKMASKAETISSHVWGHVDLAEKYENGNENENCMVCRLYQNNIDVY